MTEATTLTGRTCDDIYNEIAPFLDTNRYWPGRSLGEALCAEPEQLDQLQPNNGCLYGYIEENAPDLYKEHVQKIFKAFIEDGRAKEKQKGWSSDLAPRNIDVLLHMLHYAASNMNPVERRDNLQKLKVIIVTDDMTGEKGRSLFEDSIGGDLLHLCDGHADSDEEKGNIWIVGVRAFLKFLADRHKEASSDFRNEGLLDPWRVFFTHKVARSNYYSVTFSRRDISNVKSMVEHCYANMQEGHKYLSSLTMLLDSYKAKQHFVQSLPWKLNGFEDKFKDKMTAEELETCRVLEFLSKDSKDAVITHYDNYVRVSVWLTRITRYCRTISVAGTSYHDRGDIILSMLSSYENQFIDFTRPVDQKEANQFGVNVIRVQHRRVAGLRILDWYPKSYDKMRDIFLGRTRSGIGLQS